jgi:Fe-S-cluster-containing dehydrogenase component
MAMNLGRRDFFKILSAGAVTATGVKPALAEPRRELPPKAIGILYDATLCIGCKSCEVACKKRNHKEKVHSEIEEHYGVSGVWDSARDLDSNTMNKIKLYKNGTGAVKDREVDGFSFIKRACMHCIDPNCISACPVSALTKDPVTGIVKYNIDACCGCRYCQVACPYLIPKFEYQKALPQLVKCELCRQVVSEGGLPGCCEFCPTGASIFGPVPELLEEAKKRLTMKAGDIYDFPISKVDAERRTSKPVAKYINYIYGEKEGGGTQYMMLSAVPFEKLGLPILSDHSDAALSEGIQHTIYKGMILPIALLAGLSFMTYRSTKDEDKSE